VSGVISRCKAHRRLGKVARHHLEPVIIRRPFQAGNSEVMAAENLDAHATDGVMLMVYSLLRRPYAYPDF